MTAKEALAFVKDQYHEYDSQTVFHEFGHCVDESLNKCVPMKPDFIEEKYFGGVNESEIIKIPVCPVCGIQIVNFGFGWICTNSHCRQAIDYE